MTCNKSMSTKYEVQQYTFCEGWVNTWTICENDQIASPEYFDSYAEAQAELDNFFAEIASEIASGERPRDNGYDREDFRIVTVNP